jgi:hypothetical protein
MIACLFVWVFFLFKGGSFGFDFDNLLIFFAVLVGIGVV